MRRALQRFLVPWFSLLEVLYALYVPMILFTLAGAAFTFYVELYPKIPQEFGGARPRYACLDVVKAQLSRETIEDILPIEPNKPNDPVVHSLKVEILFSGSAAMLVRAHGRVHKVTNNIIQAVSICD